MANRWLHDNTAPLMVAIATAKAVARGDTIGISGGTLVTAADTTWDTDTATTQAAFAAVFVGLSAQTKAAGTARAYGNGTDNIVRVDTAGLYEVDLAAATTLAVGDFLAPAKDTGNALLANTFAKTTVKASACFVVMYPGTSATQAIARLVSKLTPVD